MRFSEDYNMDRRFWEYSPEDEVKEEARARRDSEEWPEVSERFSEMTETDITNSPLDEQPRAAASNE